eukprot:5311720-Amphidinium_carterae.2
MFLLASRSGRKVRSARAVFSQLGRTPRPRTSRVALGWTQPPGGFQEPGPGVSRLCCAQTRTSRPSRQAGKIPCSQHT